MTGRGQTTRGGGRSNTDYLLDINRRGRGRPRKFPLAASIQIPSETIERPEGKDFRRNLDDGPYIKGHDDQKHEKLEEKPEGRIHMEKIRQIQQEKMLIVTPMSQKRVRGRPSRRGTSTSQSQIADETLDDEIIADQDLLESGPIEGPSERKSDQPVVLGRRSRTRQVPKRLNDFVQHRTLKKNQEGTVSIPLPLAPNAVISNDDAIEPLVPNETHIEELEEGNNREIGKEPQLKRQVEPDSLRVGHIPREELEPETDDETARASPGPPPAPKHLANKANSRGRPANPIPPHRRPLPKDLVPPGFQFLKRPSSMRDCSSSKRRDIRDKSHSITICEETTQSPLPMSGIPIAAHQVEKKPEESKKPLSESDASITMTSIEHSEDNVPQGQCSSASTSTAEQARRKEREGGKDLPSEHFPKEKARHVSIRGLHPFTEKSQVIPYDIRDSIIIHHEDIEQQEETEGVAQQRVLTLQGGSFIEDRIGRADMMEDEETRVIKNIQPQQYIVEENGMNVVYEMDPNAVIEGEEQVEMEVTENPEEGYEMEEHHKQREMQEEDDDDELPPQLVPEGIAEGTIGDEEREEQVVEQKGITVDEDGNFDFNMMDEGDSMRLHSPGGRAHDVRLARDEQGNSVFIDENGHIVELITDSGALVEPSNMVVEQGQQEDDKSKEHIRQQLQQIQQQHQQQAQHRVPGGAVDRQNLEFNFLDTNNICCGLCGEIVAYEKLVSEHLPTAHPEYLTPGVELEEVPYDNWLKTRLKQESKMMENGFRHYDDHNAGGFGGTVRLYSKGLRQMRKVSQIRVNVNEMSMNQLEIALKRKLVEKMGRKVPVSLVDRLHARCDLCQAVVSLNKKFEVVHLVRHFNAWHPAEHRCSQDWKDQPTLTSSNARRPLSLHDFAVVSTDTDQNNLQCIWCGMMMDRAALGMHFSEVHSQQVIVPNCSLCLQEMVMTARLLEKYGEDFGISLPDEFHLLSSKLNAKYSSEKVLDKAIDQFLKRSNKGSSLHDGEDMDDIEAVPITNSQQSFGRRNRLKRKFVKPCFRQICPTNSEYFEPKSACEWKCRLCNRNVYGAVISAGAIKHYKEFHPSETERMQYEIVKARLERIGDGSMEFVHPQLVECLICNLTYALHKPFNICRAIRHLRLKHPEVMPENNGKSISGASISETTDLEKPIRRPLIRFGDLITNPIELERFRKDNFDQQFDKVQVVYGIKKNDEPAFILLMENEKMDLKTALEMAEKIYSEEETAVENRFDERLTAGEDDAEQEMDQQRFGSPSDQNQKSSEMFCEEMKPQQMALDDFQEQIVEEEEVGDEMEEIPAVEAEFIQAYDANNPDHVLIEENDIINGDNYEMIQESEYQDMVEDSRTVRYLTEEEIREAQARGEILEFEEEYVEEFTG